MRSEGGRAGGRGGGGGGSEFRDGREFRVQTLASSPGRREEVESSVQWCCFVPQSEQRRHSARSAGGWCCHMSVVGACSP